jgi:hypothetical protein
MGAKLTPPVEDPNPAEFGVAVSLSDDGNTALIGGNSAHFWTTDSGAAWIYSRSGSTWTQAQELLPNDPDLSGVGVGQAVALSGDGNTALVGAQSYGGGAGRAWIFTRSGSNWVEQQALTPSDASGNACFGVAVALSTDGNTALIGGQCDAGSVGAAWVYTRSGSTWTQQGSKLTANDEVGAPSISSGGRFGISVSLSGDGNTALIGGSYDSERAGAVWIFTRSGVSWTQQGSKLTPSHRVSVTFFGASVALSADGATALIGSPTDGGGNGAAWVFTDSGSGWTQQGSKLTASDASSGSSFGSSVALSDDGNVAVIGAPTNGTTYKGAAWGFTRSGATWTQATSAIAPNDETGGPAGTPNSSRFGSSIALSADAGTMLAGGLADDWEIGNAPNGAAWVFTGVGTGTPVQQGAKLTAPVVDPNPAAFGTAVSLSNDGDTALIGGDLAHSSVSATATGAAWIYSRSGSNWTPTQELLPSDAGLSNVGQAVALSGDGNTAVIGGGSFGDGAGAAWIFARSGSSWVEQQKLTPSDPSGNACFGSAVSLSTDGSTALIGGHCDSNGVGAAWVFTRSGSTWTQQSSKLTANDEVGAPSVPTGGEFGSGVALSGDGNAALIGGPFDSERAGAAWIFKSSGGSWTQQGSKLTPVDGTGGSTLFGQSVALSADGATALIGGPGDGGGNGAAWAFSNSGSDWTQQGSKLTPSDPAGSGSSFGSSVALSNHGYAAVIGAPSDGGTGAAWGFTRTGGPWTQATSSITPVDEAGAGRFGSSIAVSAETGTMLVGGPADDPQPGGASNGAAWVFAGVVNELDHFTVTVPDGPEQIGVPFNVQITAVDRAGNTVPGWNGTVTVSSNRSIVGGSFTSAPFSNGKVTQQLTLSQGGSASTISATVTGGTSSGVSRAFTVAEVDGGGAMVVASPPSRSVANGADGYTLEFEFVAAAGGMAGGALTLHVPAGWSAPSLTPSAPGYVTTSKGTLGVAGSTITVSGLSLETGRSVWIFYGASPGPGATTPTTGGGQTWQAMSKGRALGTLQPLASSPAITVLSANGSGTVSVSPSSVTRGSTGHTLHITFTAAAGGTVNGYLKVFVPGGWPAPSTNPNDPGYVTSSKGSLAISSRTIIVRGITVAGGGTVDIVYGSKAGGGPGATAPSKAGTYAWPTREISNIRSGGYVELLPSPTVTVS